MVVTELMTLEEQLLQEIAERQAKLEAIQQAKPKLNNLSSVLDEVFNTCQTVGMGDLLLNLLKEKLNAYAGTTSTIITSTQPNSEPSTQTPTNTNTQTPTVKDEFKAWAGFEGKRLRDITAKELCIKKLTDVGREDVLDEVDLDNLENFWNEIEKVLDLVKTPIKEVINVGTELITDVPSPVVVSLPVVEVEAAERIEAVIKPEQILTGAIAQDIVTQQIGTIQTDGIVADVSGKECAVIQYRGGKAHTPISQLKLIVPASQPQSIPIPVTPVEAPTQEVIRVLDEIDEIIEAPTESELTPQDLQMWEELLASGFDEKELNAFSVDPDILRGYNSQNGTNYTVLPISALYTYTLNKPAITA